MLTLRESGTDPDSASLRAVAFAGTFAALSASLLICRVPEAHPGTLSARALLWIACKYLFAPAAIGLGATWLYFQFSSQQPAQVFRSLVRCLCEAWLFFPAFTLLLWENSPALLALAPLAAVAVTLSLERFLPLDPEPAPLTPGQLFAEPPPLPSRSRALYTALALVAATAEIADGDLATAGFILSFASYFLIRQWSALSRRPDTGTRRNHRPPGAKRLSTSLVLAMLLTLIALLPWLRTSSRLVAELPNARGSTHAKAKHDMDGSMDAYHAILLWPFPPRQKVHLPPVPDPIAYRPGSAAARLVIPFDGSYRYFQPPSVWLAARAHVAYGSPLNVNIHSADWGPLLMEAHQPLDTPIELACCREIQMEIQNGEHHPGGIGLDIVLSDTTRPGSPAEILDAQPVLSSMPGRLIPRSAPANETLTFAIPPHTHIKQFNEITIVFMPAPDRSSTGARIAIRQFTLVPR